MLAKENNLLALCKSSMVPIHSYTCTFNATNSSWHLLSHSVTGKILQKNPDSPSRSLPKGYGENFYFFQSILKVTLDDASMHTGSLELYYYLFLKYAPNRQHFHFIGMQSRLQLAALDHNQNVN